MIPAGQAVNCLALITDIKSVKELLPIEVEHKQCYRVYFAEFRRKSRLTMGVLPGLRSPTRNPWGSRGRAPRLPVADRAGPARTPSQRIRSFADCAHDARSRAAVATRNLHLFQDLIRPDG